MASTCPIGFDVAELQKQVRETYDRVVREPEGEFHFHRGLNYACQMLGYDRRELEDLPEDSTARFAGVGNPHRIGSIESGETILDIGCGAGMDLLLAAHRTGPGGKVIGVDMTPAMRERAKAAAIKAGLWQIVDIRAGTAEALPVEDSSIDVVISNGVINLSPDKIRAFKEIFRVLRPGGRLYLADVVVQRELTLAARSDIDLWAAWIAGALPEAELTEITAACGLLEGRVVERFDCFQDTSALAKVSKDLRVQGVNFYARRGTHGGSTPAKADARV